MDINLYLRIALLIGLLFYFICIFNLLRKNNLALRYTLMWIVTGFIMVLVVLFPTIIKVPLQAVGVVEWTNGIFALLFLFLIIIVMSITSIVSKMNDRNRQLIQKCALFERRLRDLENSIKEQNDTN